MLIQEHEGYHHETEDRHSHGHEADCMHHLKSVYRSLPLLCNGALVKKGEM